MTYPKETVNTYKTQLHSKRAGIADFMICVKPGEESIQIGHEGEGQTPIHVFT